MLSSRDRMFSVKFGKTLVIGVGEVGGPLATVLEREAPVLKLDIEPQQISGPIDVMHVCFPYRSDEQFISAASDYVRHFRPSLTIINSTVVPGTTRAIAGLTSTRVAYSPIRGKHQQMAADIRRYTKFVAAEDPKVAEAAERHFQAAALRTKRIARTETLELAKVAETSYFGVLIAFAQELNRYAERLGGDYDEAASFFEEVDFLPRCKYFPGFIGGHCVIPNTELLLRVAESPLLQAVLDSNQRRAVELDATSEPKVRVPGKP